MEDDDKLALKRAVCGNVRGKAHILRSLGLMLSWPIALLGFNSLSTDHMSCSVNEIEQSWLWVGGKSLHDGN